MLGLPKLNLFGLIFELSFHNLKLKILSLSHGNSKHNLDAFEL